MDSGADISLVKSYKLFGTAEFEPKDRVRVKSVDGSVVETHGSIETRIRERGINIPFRFQLVSKQVDLKGDGIIGRDFFKSMQAQICYKERSLTVRHAGCVMRKKLISVPELERDAHRGVGVGKLTIPARTELIVRLLVSVGSHIGEGLVEKAEIASGVYLADSLIKVNNVHIITSILNTREQEVELPKPVVNVIELRDNNVGETVLIGVTEQEKSRDGPRQSRGESVIAKLRTDHLNSEEKKSIHELCFDYQDVFCLPGDKLSCTNAARHAIQLEPEVTPHKYTTLPTTRSQREEIDRQMKQLLEDGIIDKSHPPWNSPLLIAPKKVGPDGKRKWRLVVDFRKLNEKTVGDAYPLPDITEILDQLGQSKYFTCPDMVMVYHEIELAPGEGPKSAFSTKQSHWEYRRLLLGIKTVHATFQKLMNSVLNGLTGTRCFVYLDDIVIYARSLADHNTKLREVLDRLRMHRLKLQPHKCEFLRKEVNYLGHQITEAG